MILEGWLRELLVLGQTLGDVFWGLETVLGDEDGF